MHTLSTGIHSHKPLGIKVVNLFPYAVPIFGPTSSLFIPSLQIAPTFVLLASIGENQAAFEPADPRQISCSSAKGEDTIPDSALNGVACVVLCVRQNASTAHRGFV